MASKDPEKRRAYARAWYAKNIEKNRERAREYQRQWRAKNPEKHLARVRRYLGVEGATGEVRSGTCPICPPGAGVQTLVCDHEHGPDGSGPIRGWICRKCNSGLGLLGDVPDGLERALAYLTGGRE
jgi:hypothetical protein